MNIQEFSWQTADNLSIYGCHWPVDKPRAVVGVVHGLGEHCRRYGHVAEAFAKAKIATIGYDRRGHGQSEGKKGHTISYQAFQEEIVELIKHIEAEYPETPLFLYGHSMGGNLVLQYALKNPDASLAGIISSAPWIRLPNPPSGLLVVLAKVMSRLYPAFTQPNGLKTEHLSKDEEVVKAYINDPLVHDRITAKTAAEMMEAADELNQFSGAFPLPLLLMHGAEDHITDPVGSKEFVDRISGQAEHQLFEGMYHEIHNEAQQEKVFQKMIGWMESILVKTA